MALVDDAEALLKAGRADDARQLLRPAAERPAADLQTLTAYALALKTLGRRAEALGVYRTAVGAAPTSGVAEHNLAALLGDMGRHAEAEAAARRALAKGLRAPETALVLARALMGQARLAESAEAFRSVLQQQPGNADAQLDYAQLVWMRSGSGAEAAAALDAAVADASRGPSTLAVKARLLGIAGDAAGERAALEDATRRFPADAALAAAASRAAAALGDGEAAVVHAQRACGLAPEQPDGVRCLAEAQLAAGAAVEAGRLAHVLLRLDADDQGALALLATAWRLLGYAGYRKLYDYDAFVSATQLAIPPGWPTLAAYLHDLARALVEAHPYAAQPLHQSVRGGSQRPDLLGVEDRAIQALPAALDPPIRAAIARLGQGVDPVRRRNTGSYTYGGIWSVRLRPGGRHVDHVHPQGWLSSACHVELPPSIGSSGGDHAGWLGFGRPGLSTRPKLEAEHWVRPEPGKLVLFPSYMWHGTEPFQEGPQRLTVAFDLLPA